MQRPAPLYVVPERAAPLLDYVPSGRRLHLVDMENLAMGPFASPGVLRRVFQRYRTLAPVGARDHVVIAVNPALATSCHEIADGALLRCGGGPDGADYALLQELADLDWVIRRFDEVIFGSGDHIFCFHARVLKQHGLTVGVVGVEGHISNQLQKSATFVRRMKRTPQEAA